MQEAHDLIELKKLILQLGLNDERRQSPRYNVEIAGNYKAGTESSGGTSKKCWLVDVSKEGLSVKVSEPEVREGTILHLTLPKGTTQMSIAARVVHVEPEEGYYIVGLKSTSEKGNIIQQLLSN